MFAPHGDASAPIADCPRRQARVGLLLPLGLRQLLLDLPQAGHGAVDGGRAHQVEVVHADQVQQEVAAELAADDVSAPGLCEEHDGLVHLVVRDEAAEKRWRRVGWNAESHLEFDRKTTVKAACRLYTGFSPSCSVFNYLYIVCFTLIAKFNYSTNAICKCSH